MIYQWETDDPKGTLPIPAELLATQHYRFVTIPPEVGLIGTCSDFEESLGSVMLKECLVDTSERVMGTVFKKRVTYRKELHLIGGAIGVVLFPFNPDDGEEG